MSKMKIFIKKLLPFTLAIMMLISSGVMASAKSFTDVSDNYDYKEQIDILSDIGVIVGTSDKEFSPEEKVTREQMAMFLFRLMLGRDNAGTVNSTSFTDLYDETYHGAISWANAAGYLIGTSDKTFEPTGGIALQDAMTMIIRALGQSTAAMDRGYPWTYIDAAVKLDLDNGLESVRYTDTLTRAQLAALLYNALTAEYLVVRTSSNGTTYVESTTVIESVYGYEIENATLVATNNYAIGGNLPVVKNGYVTFVGEDGTMTVSFEETNLEGSADEWLGKEVKIIYSVDKKTNTVKVLGTTYSGSSKVVNSATFASDNSYVELDSVKYTIVETLSDKLSTNKNELLLYVYDNDGTLTQVTNTASLAAIMGICDITLIYDNANSDTADRAIMKNYSFGQVSISDKGEINIAANLTSEQLTGGIVNAENMKNGSYALYYFNPANKSLEISSILEVAANQLVTKITATTAVIGGIEYTLGHSALGISAESIRNSLTIGAAVNIVTANGYVLAVPASAAIKTDSQYLVLVTAPVPVYTEGNLRYIAKAHIGDKTIDIFVSTPSALANEVYRYTADGNGIYTLTAYESDNFTQSDEIKDTVTALEAQVSAPSSNGHFTFNGTNFVTDENTVITVLNDGEFYTVNGKYLSTINIDQGAEITAVYKNEIGNVETLLFMYVSSGSLGSTVYSNNNVKILKKISGVYIDGKIYTEYTVYNYSTGLTQEAFSTHNDLVNGTSYVLDSKGYITNAIANTQTGLVTGYTSSTVTVNGTIYKIADAFKAVSIALDNTVSAATVAGAYMKEIEFITDGNTIYSMIVKDYPIFTAQQSEGGIKVTASVSIDGVTASAIKLVSITDRDVNNVTLTMNDANGFDLACDGGFANGTNNISFTLNGILYNIVCEVTNVPTEDDGEIEDGGENEGGSEEDEDSEATK